MMTGRSGPARRRERLLLLLGLVGLVAIGVWLLLLEPEEAGSTADILAMILTGVGVVVAIMLRPGRPRGDAPGAAVRPAPNRAATIRLIVFAVVVLALTAGLTVTVWHFATTSAITVTGVIELRDHERMPDGAAATVILPGPAHRENITLVPVITNTGTTGDCVDPAQLVVTPVVDGRPGTSTVVRSGEPARVSIEGATRGVSVTIVVDQSAGDPSCVVSLRIDRAFLHG